MTAVDTMWSIINTWLADSNIPALVKAQVKGLLNNKLISLASLSSAIQICEYAGQPERALPFMTAMLFMKSEVDVEDVYRMARERGRPVNVNWSSARWKQEHDKLSRMVTFETLQKKNNVYDVSSFASKLPERWPGYIIRNSRRLAMEGLRQRHCVAVYDDRCTAGALCIVVVFLNKQRWTVELSQRKDGSVFITQAATRFNKQANGDIKAKLCDILGIIKPAQDSPMSALNDDDDQEDTKVFAARILAAMRQHGINALSCTFDGSGDSGQVDSVQYKMDANQNFVHTPKPDVTVQVQVDSTQYDQELQRFIRRVEVKEKNILDAFEDLAYRVLDETNVDWYNNEGGYGDMTLFADSGHFVYEVYQRFSNSNLEAFDTWVLDEEN